ncbi:MAG: hypothetical protein M1829_004639 [Trizodia sp. TS-e1964]|nr:MAG: hypothetical protein M1829_004639 [Trizodia sp. TS-e1964]
MGAQISRVSVAKRKVKPRVDYRPTVGDIVQVRHILLSQKLQLPIEIVDLILDQACYWASTSVSSSTGVVATGARRGVGDRLVLRTLPLGYCGDGIQEHEVGSEHMVVRKLHIPTKTLDRVPELADTVVPPRGAHPCRKIEFDIVSHDQGWAGEPGHNTYKNSYTWFDAGIEKIVLQPQEHEGEGPPKEASSFAWDEILHTASPEDLLPLSSSSSETSEREASDDKALDAPIPPLPRPQFHLPLTPSQIDIINNELHNVPPSPTSTEASATPSITFTPKHPVDAAGALAHAFLPPSTRIQSNKLATRASRRHVIHWSYLDVAGPESPEGIAALAAGRGEASVDGAFVRRLELGDCVTLWAHARFPGWRNHVESAKVTVWWAV